MAASAAKYGHCQVRHLVEYRSKVPFRPELIAPLDMAVRTAEILGLDRELDRAVLQVGDYADLLWESVEWRFEPVEALAADLDPGRRRTPPARRTPTFDGRAQRQFLVNELQFLGEEARFQPPWTLSVVQEAHVLLLRSLTSGQSTGEFRTTAHHLVGVDGRPVYRACPPERIPAELAAILTWVDRSGPTLHPVIPAAVLLQGFHSIRPFPVGNLTVGWTLAHLYLHQFGLPNSALVPAGRTVLSRPELLRRLMLWTEATDNYGELVDYLIDAILIAYREGADRWLRARPVEHPLEETALRILTQARRRPGWFTAREAAGWVGNRNDQTVLRHLNELVRRGIFETLGRTRGKRYRVVPRSLVLPTLARRFSGRPDSRSRAASPSFPAKAGTVPNDR